MKPVPAGRTVYRRFLAIAVCLGAILAGADAADDAVRPLSDDEIRALLNDVTIEPVDVIVYDHTEIFRQNGILTVVGRGTFSTQYSIKNGAVHIKTLDPTVVQCRSVFRDRLSNLYFAACGKPFSFATAMRFRTVPARH